MGLGIGKYCEICENQLNTEDGYNYEETLCLKCEQSFKIFKHLTNKGSNNERRNL